MSQEFNYEGSDKLYVTYLCSIDSIPEKSKKKGYLCNIVYVRLSQTKIDMEAS